MLLEGVAIKQDTDTQLLSEKQKQRNKLLDEQIVLEKLENKNESLFLEREVQSLYKSIYET